MSHGPCGLGGAPLAPVAACAFASVAPVSIIASTRIIAAFILNFIVDPFRVAKITSDNFISRSCGLPGKCIPGRGAKFSQNAGNHALADELDYRFFNGDRRGRLSFEQPRRKVVEVPTPRKPLMCSSGRREINVFDSSLVQHGAESADRSRE